MSSGNNMVYIPAAEMQKVFEAVLFQCGFEKEKAIQCAAIFTNNSVDGIYTHGVNRFPRFVQYVKDGFVKAGATPSLQNKFGGIEQWNGNLGPGPLNAVFATEMVMRLSQQHGIGCVAMSNTNHWMRGGAYGWQAAKAGCVFIGWTNTLGNMPAWGATDPKLGNNPLVIALPYKNEAIVLDMAMSQFSFGALELAAMKNETLPVHGGFDAKGILSREPLAILASKRTLPIGYWKGAGLALLLDLLATILSGGLSTHEINKQEAEYGLSQVFIAIDIAVLGKHSVITKTIEGILTDYHQSISIDASKKVVYPGERVLLTRKNNLVNGIPVMKKVWDGVLAL
jgi:3-dehydro-L-gulonate 2-dehydrogenase